MLCSMREVCIYRTRYIWARATDFVKGRSAAFPFGMHHVDGGVHNAREC
jgi:hypothetical protein